VTAFPHNGAEDHRLAALPPHWPITRLKNIARLAYGDPLPSHTRTGGGIPVYGSNGITGDHDEANTQGPAIIIGRKGSFGKVAYSHHPCWCIDTAFYIDHRHTPTHLRWLAWTLESLGLDDASQDTAVPGLPRDLTLAIRIPVPPPVEQHHIAHWLDHICGAIDRLLTYREARLTHLALIRAALIREAITGAALPGPRRDTEEGWIGPIPRPWRVERLKNITIAATGHTPTRTDARLWLDCDIPWVSLADTEAIAAADILHDTTHHISRAGLAASSAKVMPAGAIICTRDASIGLAAMLARPMAISQHLVAWITGPMLRPQWLLYAIYAMRPELESIARGTTIGTIGMHTFKTLAIPLPTLEEQDALIADLVPRITALDRLVEVTHHQRAALTALRQALVLGATHGTLAVGDHGTVPGDGSAR
jgi:type I restriction enzyme S subunit